MVRSLPARPDLAHLKKQAKALVRSGATDRLADAQRMVARDYGFANWTELKHHVDALTVDPVDALVSAVKANDVDAATRLLEHNAPLRRTLNGSLPGMAFGSTLLNQAAESRNGEMVDVLLRFGADVNAKSHWWAGGFGALDVCPPDFAPFLLERGALLTPYSAARLGRVDDLDRLISSEPSLVQQAGGDGQTPLHVAATVEVAQYLVEHGADMDALDVDHESTPLQYAIRDRQDVARYLVARGCRTDILAASALGDLALVQGFLDADPDAVRVTVSAEHFPMRDARAGGTIYIWTLGANKPAHAVARDFGHDDVYRLLITRTPDSLKLALACEFGDASAVEQMLAAQPSLASTLSAREQQSIVAAAEGNKLDAVRLMLAAGWPVNTIRPRGATALHWAAWHGNAGMVREILRYTPSLEIEDGQYRARPLGWALHGSQNGWNRETGDYAGAVDALLTAGATLPDGDGLDVSDEILEVLHRHGVLVESPTGDGDGQVRGL